MARRLTTKLQRSGWRFIRERALKAHTMRTTLSDAPSALARQEKSALAGVGGVVLITVIGLLLSFFAPQPSLGKSKFFYTEEGGRYIVIGNTIHPVANITSARLILGKPIPATKATEKTLKLLPTGETVGILGAPEILTTSQTSPTWTVCSVDNDDNLTLISSPPTRTYITTQPQNGIRAATVMRVTQGKKTTFWIADSRGKRQFNPQDSILISALGIPQDVLRHTPDVSVELADTLPTLPPLNAPDLPHWGERSKIISHANIGDIYRWGEQKPVYVLIGENGIQTIRYTAARALGADANTPYLTSREWASTPKVKMWEDSGFPNRIPRWEAEPTVCYQQKQGTSQFLLKTRKNTTFNSNLPINKNNVTVLNFPTGVWADITRKAYGRNTTIGEVYIAPDGTLYPLPSMKKDGEIAAMLGLETKHTIPENFIHLLIPGPALLPEAAKNVIRPGKD